MINKQTNRKIRLEINQSLREKFLDTPDIEIQLRKKLRAFPAATVIKLIFGKDQRQICDYVRELIKEPKFSTVNLSEIFKTRSRLLGWIHGFSSSLSRDLLYVRLPSTEKLRLINLVLASLRKPKKKGGSSYKWLTSRIIHAYAFKPNAFGANKRMNNPLTSWGKLYKKRTIPKCNGARHLWIPNPALKSVQGALLRLLAPNLKKVLHTNVFGAGGANSSIFHNAASHLDKKFIASFDLKDFFPSTRISDVIRGLAGARNKKYLMVEASQAPKYLLGKKELRDLEWSTDAIILISKLGTHQSKLPQGSPLSPMLANIAFNKYDFLIIKALNNLFTSNHFIYTRYFDDITISVSSKGAAESKLDSPSKFCEKVEQIISKELEKSSYSINKNKIHCGLPEHGCDVTGLLVHKSDVRLSRLRQRELRSIIFKLNSSKYKLDFVKEAIRWFAYKEEKTKTKYETPKFVNLKSGHRWLESGLTKRRTSAERLAITMLRWLSPDLQMEIILPDWSGWRTLIAPSANKGENAIKSGKKMWPLLEPIFSQLWNNQFLSTIINNRIEINDGKGVICLLTVSERAAGLFSLGFQDAVKVTEYWHYLRGLESFLSTDNSPPFKPISDWGRNLKTALDNIYIPFTCLVEQGARSSIPPADTWQNGVQTKCKKLWDNYYTFITKIATDITIQEIRSLPAKLNKPCKTLREYEEWISNLYDLFVRRLATYPVFDESLSHFKFKPTQLLFYFRIRCHTTLQSYIHPIEIEGHNWANISPTAIYKIQCDILDVLIEWLQDSPSDHNSFPKNIWYGSLIKILDKQRNSFHKVFDSLVTTRDKAGFFTAEAGVASAHPNSVMEFTNYDFKESNISAIEKLNKTCLNLSKYVKEGVNTELSKIGEFDVCHSEIDKKREAILKASYNFFPEVKETFTLISLIRNSYAHLQGPSRKNDASQLAKKISKFLESEFKKDAKLELSSYECCVLEIEMFRMLNKWIDQVQKVPLQ